MKRDYREYNTKYHPLIKNTYILMGDPFEHALQKATSYDEAVSNLKILGWNEEWKKFIIEAVEYYSEYLKQNAPILQEQKGDVK